MKYKQNRWKKAICLGFEEARSSRGKRRREKSLSRGEDLQFWQIFPEYPVVHKQVYPQPLVVSKHVPPLRHGLFEHASPTINA